MDQSDPTTEAELEFESLEDAPTPLHVIATDLLSGHELRLSEGDALEALMASAAIPSVFPTVERNAPIWPRPTPAAPTHRCRRASMNIYPEAPSQLEA